MIELIAGVAIGIAAHKKLKVLKDKLNVPSIPKLTRIVKFPSGEYALRKGYFGAYNYKDLGNNLCWWSLNHSYFKDCLGTLEQVKNASTESVHGEPID